jgi:carboxypeptidase family protein
VNAIRARSAKLWLSFALLSVSQSLSAQISFVNLSGSVKDSSGSAIAAVKVVAKNLNTKATQDSHTDSAGNFGLSLEPGAYELSVTADGFESRTAMVTIAPNAAQSLTFSLAPVANSNGGNLPYAPSATQTGPSLSDLGFPPAQT